MDFRSFLLILMSPVVFGQTPDLTTAFQQYVDSCSPNRLCPTSSEVYPPLKYNITLPSVCPPCDCDERCILRGTCCPDLLFSGKAVPSCVDVTIIGDDRREFYMIPACRDKDSCTDNSLEVRLKDVPVSSMATSYSYETKALAEKYENSATFVEWGIEFACNTSMDFNFISKYSRLIESVQRENCSIRYIPSDMMKVQECSNTVNTISRCNRTGLWVKYDPGIDWACSNYYQHSGLFDNIFCRLCNPSNASVGNGESLISVCNHTGLWQSFDKEVEDGCLSSSRSHVSYPFKNVFCWICNTGSKTMPYKEMNGYISETIEEHGYRYQFNMTGFSEEYASKLKQMGITKTSESYPNMIWRDGQWINKSSLVAQYQAATGKSTCDKTIVTGCVCDSSCFEDGSKECCIDFLLDFNMDFPVFKHSQNILKQSSLAISSCSIKNTYTYECLNHSDDFFGIFPVTDLSENLHYRNIYCYLCNKNNISDFNSVLPWNLTIKSPELLDIQFYTSIMEVLNLVSRKELEIILTPHVTTWPKRQSLGSVGSACNTTGFWKTFDSDVSWACNSLHLPNKMYRDKFCTICSPRNPPRPSRWKRCNITKAWDLLDYNIKTACSVFPEVAITYPFKNQFCKYCNIHSSSYLVITTQSPKESDTNSELNTASLRDIFGVFRGKEETTCSHLHFKTQAGDCRKQRCYPGKILTKEGCIPLLPVTKNLNYSIHFSLGLANNISITKNAMEILVEEVTSVIRSILNVTNVKFISKVKLFTLNHNFTLTIGTNFFVGDMIPRLKSEILLVSLRRNPKKFLQIKNVHFLEPNLTKFVLEQNISTLEIGTPMISTQAETIYRHVIISSLITCKQVELFEDEIEMLDIKTKRIRILNSRAELDESEYYVTENGAYAVCVDIYCADSSCSEVPTSESNLEKALRIFTIVCTVPSLLCLIATFIHYCLFKRLRTTPGIHFMSLTVSLFFSQFFFQFFLRKNFQNDSICQVMGLVIHFWWLATFCCYALNGYLMFMTFRANVDFHSSDQRISKGYFLFSYGVPLAVVFLTFVVNLLSSGDIGYGTDSVCFLNNTVSLIVSFLLVIGIVCICNFAFFIFVIYKLFKYKKQQQLLGINKNDMNMISIFFKLFFISGLSWTFFIIDAIIPEPTVFSFFVTFVNCLQGVLVFSLEVCKKRSREMYKDFKNYRKQGRPRQLFSSSKQSVLREASRRASRSGSDGSVNPAFSSIEEDASTTASTII